MTTQTNVTNTSTGSVLFNRMTGGSEGNVLAVLSKLMQATNMVEQVLLKSMLMQLTVAFVLALGSATFKVASGFSKSQEHNIKGDSHLKKQKFNHEATQQLENSRKNRDEQVKAVNDAPIVDDAERNRQDSARASMRAEERGISIGLHRSGVPKGSDSKPSRSRINSIHDEFNHKDSMIREKRDADIHGIEGKTEKDLQLPSVFESITRALSDFTDHMTRSEEQFANNTYSAMQSMYQALREMLRINPVAVGTAA